MSADTKARRQVEALQGWIVEASTAIYSKLADAEAHLERALTETLKRTPDGRPTLRKAMQSPSYPAALGRLDELWIALAGPSVRSLDGLIRDAREAFYRDAFEEWRPLIPEHLLIAGDRQPTVANIARVRGMVLHGLDLRQELGGPIGRARAKLPAVLTLAARQASTERIVADLVSTWERQSRDAVIVAAKLALSDSQVACDVLAGRDLIHPKFLDESPIAVGA